MPREHHPAGRDVPTCHDSPLAHRLRAAALTVWVNAWLDGRVSYDEAVAQVTGTDEPHRISGLTTGHAGDLTDSPGAADPVPLGWALAELRSRGAARLRLVLPVAGDPRGLLPGSEFASAALQAGEASVGCGLGMVPVVTRHGSSLGSHTMTVLWHAYQIPQPKADPLQLADAEHELSTALRDAADALAELDVASWRPDMAGAVAAVRRTGPMIELPDGHDPRAARLLAQADRLGAVLQLAECDAPGGSLTSNEAARRAELLRPLATAVRRARLAAYNAEPARHC